MSASENSNRSRTALRVLLILVLLSAGCAGNRRVETFTPPDFNEKIRTGLLVPKIQTFLVILDASGSMERPIDGRRKLDLAKVILLRINKAIPDIPLTSAIRIFGKGIARELDMNTGLIYGPTHHNRRRFQEALRLVRFTLGKNLLGRALVEAGADLAPYEGDAAVLIVSDGKFDGRAAAEKSKGLKDRVAGRLFAYGIHIKTDTDDRNRNLADRQAMDQVINTFDGGFSVNSDEIADPARLYKFVERIFLRRPDVEKTDAEAESEPVRITDLPDLPEAPASPGEDLKSPRFPQDNEIFDAIHFSPAEAELHPLNFARLEAVAGFLLVNPAVRMILRGHTDAEEPNKPALSKSRAAAVKKALTGLGVEPERLFVEGVSASMPSSSNLSPVGRADNRRVEFILNP